MNKIIITTLALAACAAASLNAATFNSYVIRSTPVIQPNNDYVAGATEFITLGGGQKAGLGTSAIDGLTLGDVTNVGIVRHDDTTRFGAGSGPAVAPYFNVWVTDGLGNYAVLANEPSNPSFAPYRTAGPGNGLTYSFSFADIAAEPVQVYETPNGGYNATNTWVHNLLGINGPLTFGDVLGLTIEAPDATYITNPANAVGSGAPDELGTNMAYGFNWIFGDTLSNYVSGDDGFIVSGAAAIPEPSAIALLGLGGLALALIRRRR